MGTLMFRQYAVDIKVHLKLYKDINHGQQQESRYNQVRKRKLSCER